jgi:hypothetical protein
LSTSASGSTPLRSGSPSASAPTAPRPTISASSPIACSARWTVPSLKNGAIFRPSAPAVGHPRSVTWPPDQSAG